MCSINCVTDWKRLSNWVKILKKSQIHLLRRANLGQKMSTGKKECGYFTPAFCPSRVAWCWRWQKRVRSSTAPSPSRYYPTDAAAMFAEVRRRDVLIDWLGHTPPPPPLAVAISKHIQFAFCAVISLLSPGLRASGTDNTAEHMRLPVTEPHCFGRQVLQGK